MHLDVVAVLVVFCIAFTVSLRSDTSNNNEFLPQPLRHMRRHHRHDERYVAKNKERNRNSNSNNNHRHPNDNNNKNGNRKRGRQMSTSRHGHQQQQQQQHGGGGDVLERSGGVSSLAFPSTLLHNTNTNYNNRNNNNNNNGGEVIMGGGVGGGGTVVECCPSETRMVELSYGVSRNNTLLEIYNNASKPQRFYEVVCAPNVTNRTCRYVDAALQPYSSCVERFTYTYAIVRDIVIPHNVHVQHHVHRAADNSEWRLDYIRISSGCFCEFRNFVNR